jgi:hypothetical protein
VDGVANDVFLVDDDCDTDALARHLSAPDDASRCSRWLHALLDARPC